eukprot:g1494.t3
MARNDPAGTVPEPESRRFMAAVRRVKEELDPDGTGLDLHDTGTDMEIFPRVMGSKLSQHCAGVMRRYAFRALTARLPPRSAFRLRLRPVTTAKPTVSALGAATQSLRDAVKSREITASIVAEADAPVDRSAVLERLSHELRDSEEEMEVMLLGSALPPDRKSVAFKTPTGPQGNSPKRSVRVALPNVEDISSLLQREDKPAVPKGDELAEILEKFLSQELVGKSSHHVAMLTAWGPKTIADSEGEFGEVAALMRLSLKAFEATLKSSKSDFQFEVIRSGEGRDCLVMPPSNFALLGLKDAFHMLLQGFRVLLVVQPRFFPHFREIQLSLSSCGLPEGILEVVPGITPEADPAVLYEVLKHIDRLQFTGSSAMFKSLVTKAIELGNTRMEHAGEVSGLNKVRLDGVKASHPAVAMGTTWAAMANNGELCTSASMVEFDPALDTTDTVKSALLEAEKSFTAGRDPSDTTLDILLRDGKAENLEVKTSSENFQEWWEKTILASAKDEVKLSTNQSLGHCIFAPSITQALEGVREEASNLYFVGVPENTSSASARAGTTGAKLPESTFGGMKSYTYAVAGDHEGVGTIQTIFENTKRRGPSWRDQEEAFAQYELTEVAEMLLEFLSPRDQQSFSKQISNVLEVFKAFMPEVTAPYAGQGLVNSEGRSQLLTLQALRPTRKHFLIPRGVGLPEEIVQMAALCAMSPLKEVPADLHLLDAAQAGQLRITDPLKSFVKVVQNQLQWRVHYHANAEALSMALEKSEYPPYFLCVKDRHMLPAEVLKAVAVQGGYFSEGFPSDAFSLFRSMTTTQAWTVACTPDQVEEAELALLKAWKENGLRKEAHEDPEIIKPKARDMDIGGGFGDTGSIHDDRKWDELSDDEESDEEVADNKPKGSTAAAS